MLTRAVANQQHPKAAKITFRASRYPSNTLGQQIRKHRLQLGLKQVELAQLLGVNEMTVVKWETGKTEPRGKLLQKVHLFLAHRPGNTQHSHESESS